jgi:hypothetical protein
MRCMNWYDAEKFLIYPQVSPTSPRIGDALGTIFGAKSSAKGRYRSLGCDNLVKRGAMISEGAYDV